MSKEIVKIDKLLKLLPLKYESKKLWLYENKRYGYEVLELKGLVGFIKINKCS